MDFRAIQVLCLAVSTLMDEMAWNSYGEQGLHTPTISVQDDCHRLDILMDLMGTLTRLMDTRIAYITTEGKVVREWIETILEIGGRYKRELETLAALERKPKSDL
jgi:hypothetical protein